MCGTTNSSFGECIRQAHESLPAGVKIIARLVLAYGTPALLYCIVINDALPFYVTVCYLAIGFLGGVWLHKRQPDSFSTNALVDRSLEIPRGTPVLMIRKLLRVRPAHSA